MTKITSGEKAKVVVIGGGTGTYSVLAGLKKHRQVLDITAVVTMADSGGSTGRLRDEFGYLPVGDVRMALTALAEDDKNNNLIRQLFSHRFSSEGDLRGHNVGNLLLIALTDILGSEDAAIKAASRVLNISGTVLPVTTTRTDLVATYSDGSIIVGEHAIDESSDRDTSVTITHLAVSPVAMINPEAEVAISQADLVILGPGDLYTSILANCVVDGMANALQRTAASIMYISNLMTRNGQTHGMGVREHVETVRMYIGRSPDCVVVNTAPMDPELLNGYATEGEFPVADNYDHKAVIRGNFLATEKIKTSAGDLLKRSLIRHNPDLLADCVCNYLKINRDVG